MQYNEAKLTVGLESAGRNCVVTAQTRLAEIMEAAPDLEDYLLVEDECGNPIGIVAQEDLRSRLKSATPLERRRWLDMPVESTLSNRMHMPIPAGFITGTSKTSSPNELNHECTAIMHDRKLVGLATDEDFFISWRSVEASLKHAMDDAITRLPNRAAFDRHLVLECRRARQTGHSVAVILFDVDHFKEVNDRFGHAAGDAILRAIAEALRSSLRSYDLVARFGGDEFAAICSGCRPGEIDETLKRIGRKLQDLRSNISLPCPSPTLSIGACVAHDENALSAPDRLPEEADKCLYLAKRNGRNQAYATELGVEFSC
ncbi:MAG: GGDEF domain-containing protein [Planctomycetaceae bacterium]|nr:GGDEF domain-containing protein [Planctomycetaceae bacterium]